MAKLDINGFSRTVLDFLVSYLSLLATSEEYPQITYLYGKRLP